MEGALLCALALLLAPGAASVRKEGEVCRYGTASPDGPLQCPERLESADATFCCGSCSLPRCCSSRADRLDQEKCLTAGQLKEDRSTVQPEGNTQPRAWGTFDLKEYLLYLCSAVGTILIFLTICCCFYRCRDEELEMENISPPGVSCIPGPPPAHGVDPTPFDTEDPRAPLLSPPALDDTPAAPFGDASHDEDEAIPVSQGGPPVDATGCGPTLGPSSNGEKMEQAGLAKGEDVLEQPRDGLEEQPGPGMDGQDAPQPQDDLEQPGPSVDVEDVEQPGASADGGDLEQP